LVDRKGVNDMTHEQWERGETLTIHNATKEQLKFMIKDKNRQIAELQSELKEMKAAFNELVTLLKR
jgi:hypothetical protein